MRKDSKILIIPDVHGRTFWLEAVASGSYDKVIFLGDYVDPYPWEGIDNHMALSNFKDIIALKKSRMDSVVLLLGNHDMCYYSDRYRENAESTRYDYELEEELRDIFHTNCDLFKLVHQEKIGKKEYLFSHAGVTQQWLSKNIKVIGQPDEEHLNHLLKTKRGIDSLAQVGKIRWGRHPYGSVVWADVEELAESAPITNMYQIVGHTMQYDGPIINKKFACLDCRAAFSLNHLGKIKPVTEIEPYDFSL